MYNLKRGLELPTPTSIGMLPELAFTRTALPKVRVLRKDTKFHPQKQRAQAAMPLETTRRRCGARQAAPGK